MHQQAGQLSHHYRGAPAVPGQVRHMYAVIALTYFLWTDLLKSKQLRTLTTPQHVRVGT